MLLTDCLYKTLTLPITTRMTSSAAGVPGHTAAHPSCACQFSTGFLPDAIPNASLPIYPGSGPTNQLTYTLLKKEC